MSKLAFFLLICLAILLEGTITSMPLVLDILIVFYITKRNSGIFILSFISGVVLDIFGVRVLGLTSIFFITFIFIILQYGRKFEIATYPFVFFSSLMGGLFYLWLFKYDDVFMQGVANSIIAVLMFKFSIFYENRHSFS